MLSKHKHAIGMTATEKREKRRKGGPSAGAYDKLAIIPFFLFITYHHPRCIRVSIARNDDP